MRKEKASYLIQSFIGIAAWIILVTYVTIKASSPGQAPLDVRIGIPAILWVATILAAIVLTRYYYKMGAWWNKPPDDRT
jgi:membrane protein DedA with SNARE-associated domain